MKIFVKDSFHTDGGNLYMLTIKFVEGIRIFVGDELFDEAGTGLFFKVKYIPTGLFDLNDNSFSIGIESPEKQLKEYEQKVFVLKNETNRQTN